MEWPYAVSELEETETARPGLSENSEKLFLHYIQADFRSTCSDLFWGVKASELIKKESTTIVSTAILSNWNHQ